MKLDLISIMKSLDKAQKIISPVLGKHQQQVAYLAFKLGEELGLEQRVCNRLLIAGLWHDIGALSLQEKLDAISEATFSVNTHAYRGAHMVSGFLPQLELAPIIKYHHYPWKNGAAAVENPDMPMASQILHLADRVSARMTDKPFILSQVAGIKQLITEGYGSCFVPEQVDAFLRIAKREALWLDLISDDPTGRIDPSSFASIEATIDDLIDLATIYSQIIDFRSPFTSTHSASVAHSAMKLAELMHFSSTECKKMLVAGYLHDLGKLTVDNAILEKNGKLTAEEFDVIRSHTYYTYYMLDDIAVMEDIKRWAAYHHERLNSNGYPFHLGESGLSLGSRIMAAADILSALLEKRPYKDPMPQEKVLSILDDMVKGGSLDRNVVRVVHDNFDLLAETCDHAAKCATEKYGALYEIV